MAGLWSVLWLVVTIWAGVTVVRTQAGSGEVSSGTWVCGLALAGSVVLAMLASAAWLAYRRRWWVVGLLVVYVCCLFLAWYVAAMLIVPVPAGQPDTQDDAAAVGLIFLAVPTVVGVGLLVGLGSGLGAAIWRLRTT